MIAMALATIAGGAIALALNFALGWWRSSNQKLGSPTPTSARVVSEKLEQAEKEANAKVDADIAAGRRKTAGQILEEANATREQGRGK